jgi:GH25 family lysozyme M1 (1,4-beta-N-acetylmuramidase)
MAVADSPTSVTALQEALNARAAPRGYPPLDVDGILGPLTRMALQDLGHALGIEPELLAAQQLAPEVLQLLVDPKRRSPGQVVTATDRAGQLEEREIELDGVKLVWGLVKPLVRARAAGWEGSLQSVASHSELLERLFEGARAWWHKVIVASNEGQLQSILSQMGYACELIAHSSGLLGRSGLRFLEAPGAVEPGGAVPASPAAPVPADPTAPAGTPGQPRPPAPAPGSATVAPAEITGPDVSTDNGEVDWNAVAAAGHAFAFIKATSGVNAVDDRFATNWQGAGAAGLRRAAYHVAAPEPGRDPGDEAVNLVAAIRAVGAGSDSDLPPSAAIDDLVGTLDSAKVLDWMGAFSAVFERITQELPAIRMSSESFATVLGSDASKVKSPIWLSGTGPTPARDRTGMASFEPLPATAACPGVSGSCAVSRFSGSRQQFDQLRAGTSPTS